jgi:hypothetical protein
MYQWGIKFLTIFNEHKTRDTIKAKYPKSMRKELFIEALKNISKFVDEILSQQVRRCLFRTTPKRSTKLL